MILPIVAYGHPVLRKETKPLSPNDPQLESLIEDMFETMYNARGVGLAAPQIGKAIRLFIVDGSPMDGILEDDPQVLKGWKEVFINPEILEEEGEEWGFEEGCLSIPEIRSDVYRPERLRIRFIDADQKERTEEYWGMKARIIQHEYDHLEGVLFTDYVTGLKKQLIKGKLSKISKGKIEPPYPMQYTKRS